MSLASVLQSYADDLVQHSPLLVVNEIAAGSFVKNDRTEYQVFFDEGGAPPNINQPSMCTLENREVVLLSGGSVQVLDENYLSGNQKQNMNYAASALGLTCFRHVKAKQLPVKAITDTLEIEQFLDEVTAYNSITGVLIMCPKTITELRRAFGRDKIAYNRQTNRLLTSNLFTNTYPIFAPSVRTDEIIAANWETSFAISSPKFSIRNNSLILSFGFAVQDIDDMKLFKFP